MQRKGQISRFKNKGHSFSDPPPFKNIDEIILLSMECECFQLFISNKSQNCRLCGLSKASGMSISDLSDCFVGLPTVQISNNDEKNPRISKIGGQPVNILIQT
jgi:hypothetical protein